MECLIEENKLQCPCKKTQCERHGVCCKYIASHREHGGFPACLRELVQERLAAAAGAQA